MSHKSEKTNNGNPATQNTPKKTSEVKDRDFKIHLAGEYDGSFNVKQEITRHTLTTVQTVGDAIQPFIPFFSQVAEIVRSLLQTNESAKCNQKICLALIDRVEIAQQAVNSLKRQQLANEKLFRDQNYYYAWVRFITVLGNIKKFAKEVTQLSSLQKYISAMTVKEAFDKNIKEFEDVCNDLHFTLAIYNNERREIETKKVMEDIDILLKNMGNISSDIRLVMKELTQLSTNIGELTKQIVKPESGSMGTEDIAKLKLNSGHKAPNINPDDLEPYPLGKESGKNIIKRVYRGVEVACKKILVIENNDTITEGYEPKISNFELSHTEHEKSLEKI
ncbi:675_t:CDS:2 [Cetraspora pellucida]|uniref:675_t:CDS:1 n=1 Tax=Cetraspora pellucida TaxID=1433469 RepID=A0A9N9EVN5_9GLOM|nr:675_t:CDS:2 [Cetraspora pellucida]